MAAFLHFLRTIFLPLLTALFLYLLTSHLLLPFIRRHRTRYLPLPTPTTWRTTLSDALYSLFAPSTWMRQRRRINTDEDASSDFDDEEGEGMVGFENVEERRGVLGGLGEERRVGRELEQGFRDESEDEGDEARRAVGNGDV